MRLLLFALLAPFAHADVALPSPAPGAKPRIHIARAKVVALDPIEFAFGSDELRPNQMKQLEAIAQDLSNLCECHRPAAILVHGDAVRAEERRIPSLAGRRAAKVHAALVAYGVDAHWLQVGAPAWTSQRRRWVTFESQPSMGRADASATP